MALQLTNIIRDVGVDLAQGRIYLPTEDLARFGVTEAESAPGRLTPQVARAAARSSASAAREYYRRAAATLPPVDRAQPGRRRDHGRDLFRDPRAHRASGLRRLRAPHPRAAPAAALIALRIWARSRVGLTAPRARAGCHRHWRRVRRAERGDGSGRGGARVLVLEARPALGGRATAFTDPATGERVDNGQHVLFGCYHETFAFLRRIGTESDVILQRALSVDVVDGRGVRTQTDVPGAAAAASICSPAS